MRSSSGNYCSGVNHAQRNLEYSSGACCSYVAAKGLSHTPAEVALIRCHSDVIGRVLFFYMISLTCTANSVYCSAIPTSRYLGMPSTPN